MCVCGGGGGGGGGGASPASSSLNETLCVTIVPAGFLLKVG